jgi:hypothetical protein
MTQIYCVKCREFTDTKSEKFVTTKTGRTRLTGICKICNTKKGMFANKNKEFNIKEGEELDRARFDRRASIINKNALAIGYKVLESDKKTKKCLKECLPRILEKPKKKK